ncbi:uncharacterized protein V1510DRAFT_420626 [Dipodascopsis tothii]|uniref:uncharacterized protein n=1 Tax=Dipodascopsis tothii TaxID=44089 RepID=UPI0034CE4DC2
MPQPPATTVRRGLRNRRATAATTFCATSTPYDKHPVSQRPPAMSAFSVIMDSTAADGLAVLCLGGFLAAGHTQLKRNLQYRRYRGGVALAAACACGAAYQLGFLADRRSTNERLYAFKQGSLVATYGLLLWAVWTSLANQVAVYLFRRYDSKPWGSAKALDGLLRASRIGLLSTVPAGIRLKQGSRDIYVPSVWLTTTVGPVCLYYVLAFGMRRYRETRGRPSRYEDFGLRRRFERLFRVRQTHDFDAIERQNLMLDDLAEAAGDDLEVIATKRHYTATLVALGLASVVLVARLVLRAALLTDSWREVREHPDITVFALDTGPALVAVGLLLWRPLSALYADFDFTKALLLKKEIIFIKCHTPSPELF